MVQFREALDLGDPEETVWVSHIRPAQGIRMNHAKYLCTIPGLGVLKSAISPIWMPWPPPLHPFPLIELDVVTYH